MTTHISLRLAWHDNGWNGHICKDPKSNVYCVGQHSYPGTLILESRKLEKELKSTGKHCSDCGFIPPCSYSINAFGKDPIAAASTPPTWFNDDSQIKEWPMPPSTASVWPYEEMYRDEVKHHANSSQIYDYDKRLQFAKNFFGELEGNKSLVVYYSNYSNPFCEDDAKKYVIVGMSRLKSLGSVMYYDGTSDENRKKYGGGFVWQMPISSHYPDEGICIPYHVYMDNPEVLQNIIITPENSRNFKYATRVITDDEALALVDQFLRVVNYLIEIKDKTENWQERKSWLEKLTGELWNNRGPYPGAPAVFEHLGFTEAITYLKDESFTGNEHNAFEAMIGFLNGNNELKDVLSLTDKKIGEIRRRWKLSDDASRELMSSIIPRFELTSKHIKSILSDDRIECGIESSLEDIVSNPYIICEQYSGIDPDDFISFRKIDNGMLPSPELGLEHLTAVDDARRLRALIVERLSFETQHSFVSTVKILGDINSKLEYLPEWKQARFSAKYLEVDEEYIGEAVVFRNKENEKFLYLKKVYENERSIEKQIRELVTRPDIEIKRPVTEEFFNSVLYDSDCTLARKVPEEYEKAIEGQVEVCSSLFLKPLSVVSGSAGTGKTFIISAIIKAIEKAHGEGVSFHLLAPTGKATDRIREKTGKPANTIHHILMKHGWMYKNYALKSKGGKKVTGVNTYIIDESSMIDLELMAALFRAIDWNSVQRLIFVGDPNQLPPIGRGKVFSDIIEFLKDTHAENVGDLEINLRQMENFHGGKGTGILDFASLYIRRNRESAHEDVLKRIQEGGEVDSDLRVEYWNDPEQLEEQLLKRFVNDLETITGEELNKEKPYELWNKAIDNGDYTKKIDLLQIISPYRSELYGTMNINMLMQSFINKHNIEHRGGLGGVTYFDKVIQTRNRTKSEPYWAYNYNTKVNDKIEVFNGEMGFVKPHAYDGKKWKWSGFHIRKFQVTFARREEYAIEFSGENDVLSNLELAYAISVHKSQGSDFDHVYLIIPKYKTALLSTELLYTGITRARKKLTLFIQEDIAPVLSMRRPEFSYLQRINSSIFTFNPVPDALLDMRSWYEEGKIHQTLAEFMVRSKSEVIIANMLFERGLDPRYEVPLYAKDGTFYLPDFTIAYRGKTYYWEHLGLMGRDEYRKRWEIKEKWYNKHFSGQLITTTESGDLSKDADEIIKEYFG